MKKFILLFAVAAIASFTVVEAQTITKIYGKNTLGNNPFVNFETDTLQYTPANNARLNVNVRFAIVYENGPIALATGDTIVLDLKIATKSIFDNDGDTLFYVLGEDLGANDTLLINMNSIAENMQNFPNAFTSLDEFRDEGPITATVFRTSKFSVTNKNKQVTAYFLRIANSNSVAEKAIKNVQLYPNPVSSNLTITNLKNMNVEIYNVVGQRISHHEDISGDLSINMGEFPDGIYFVKMQNGKTVRTEKIKLVK